MAYIIYIFWYVVNPMMSLGISDEPRKRCPESEVEIDVGFTCHKVTHAMGIHLIQSHGRNGDFNGENGISWQKSC